MAPHKPPRTYGRQNVSRASSSKSVDVFNALLAKNLTKRGVSQHRRKKKIEIKELSLQKETNLTDDSLQVNTEDTFDRLAKDGIINSVKLKDGPVYNISSGSDLSKSHSVLAHVSIKLRVTNRKNERRGRKKKPIVVSDSNSNNSASKQFHNSPDIVVRDCAGSNLDKSISVSLEFEKENGKVDYSTLSYIRIPDVKNDRKTELQISLESSISNVNSSVLPSNFPHHVFSSTPVCPNKKSQSSLSKHNQSIVEKSYEEILKWNNTLPSAILPDLTNAEKDNDCHTANCSLPFKKPSSVGRNLTSSLDKLSDFKGFSHSKKNLSKKQLTKGKINGDNSQDTNNSYHMKDCKVFINRIHQDLKTESCLEIDGDSKESMTNYIFENELNSVEDKLCKVKEEIQVEEASDPKELFSLSDLADLSKDSSDNTNISRSHKYETRNSIYITLRKRKVLAKSFRANKSRNCYNSRSPLLKLKEELKESCSNSDIIMETPITNKKLQKEKPQPVRLSNLIVKLANSEVSTGKLNSVKPEPSSSSDSSTDIIPMTPENAQQKSPKTHKEAYCRLLDDNGFRTKCGNVSLRKEPCLLLTRLSIPCCISRITDESNVHTGNFSRELYIPLSRLSLPSCLMQSHKSTSGENISSGEDTGSLPENISSGEDTGSSLDIKEFQCAKPIVQLEKLPSYMFHTKCNNTMENSVTSFDQPFTCSGSVQLGYSMNRSNVFSDEVLSPHKNTIPVVTLGRKVDITDCDNININQDKVLENRGKDGLKSISIITIDSRDESNMNTTIQDEEARKSYAPLAISTPYFLQSKKETAINLSHIAEVSDTSQEANIQSEVKKMDGFAVPQPQVFVKSGKAWRRSLAVSRKSLMSHKMDHVNVPISANQVERGLSKRLSVRIVPATPVRNKTRESILGTYAFSTSGYVPSHEVVNDNLDESIKDLRQLSLEANSNNQCVPDDHQQENLLVNLDVQASLIEDTSPKSQEKCVAPIPVINTYVTARDIVLRRCGQAEPLPFRECYADSTLKNCQKIGEGVYGEVFLFRNQNGGTTVMKIIPIEGDRIVNGETQKKFEEILSEIIIAMELSKLRDNKKNQTSAFNEVMQVRCVQGCYPEKLLELWDLFDETHGSENDSPEMFTEEQLYIVLELANGGKELEAFLFLNASQAYSVFEQTACALAVAENELKFEHRDLHWGNILILPVEKNKTLNFVLDDQSIEITTKGVEVTIIDYTLSRIMFEDVVIYNDLSLDPDLFTAKGDYQFDIYRLMKRRNGNEWRHFEPYSNILWLDYLLSKMINGLRYKNSQTKIHKDYIEKLQRLREEVLDYNSVKDLIEDQFM